MNVVKKTVDKLITQNYQKKNNQNLVVWFQTFAYSGKKLKITTIDKNLYKTINF